MTPAHATLAAPSDNCGILVSPSRPGTLARRTADAPLTADPKFCDVALSEWRRSLRRALNLGGPLIVSGHQAEFFHAGVFAKALAARQIANRLGGEALWLTVDSDLPKSADFALPTRAPEGRIERRRLALPAVDTQLATRWQPKVPAAVWRDFFAEVTRRSAVGSTHALRTYEDAFLRDDRPALDFCDAIERGNAALEQLCGVEPCRTLRISALAQQRAFCAFVAEIARHAHRFATDYNTAQAEYRRRHKVRNAARPAPPLEIADRRVELPFWLQPTGADRRRLHVEAHHDAIVLYSDAEPVSEFAAHGPVSAALVPAGWELDPRALTLSAFARLFLADAFIHGIGGAKYDEMTDLFLDAHFGTRGAPVVCVTATLRIAQELAPPAPPPDETQRSLRELHHNPQRRWPEAPASLLAEHQAAIQQVLRLRAEDRLNRAARRAAHLALRDVLTRVAAAAAPRRAALQSAALAAERLARQVEAALDREYFYALARESDLLMIAARLKRIED